MAGLASRREAGWPENSGFDAEFLQEPLEIVVAAVFNHDAALFRGVEDGDARAEVRGEFLLDAGHRGGVLRRDFTGVGGGGFRAGGNLGG